MLIVFETFCRYYEFVKRLYAQLGLIRSTHIIIRGGDRNQQSYPVTIFDFI